MLSNSRRVRAGHRRDPASPGPREMRIGDGGLPGRRGVGKGPAPPRSRWTSPRFTLARDHPAARDRAAARPSLHRAHGFYSRPISRWCSAGRHHPHVDRGPTGRRDRRPVPRNARIATGCCARSATSRGAASGSVERQVARDALAVYDVDELGLDRLDRRFSVRWCARRAERSDFHIGGVGGRGCPVQSRRSRAFCCEPELGAHAPGPVATAAAGSHLGHRGAAGRTPGAPRVVQCSGSEFLPVSGVQ